MLKFNLNISSNKAQEWDDKQEKKKKVKQKKATQGMQNQSNLKAKTESVNKIETARKRIYIVKNKNTVKRNTWNNYRDTNEKQ